MGNVPRRSACAKFSSICRTRYRRAGSTNTARACVIFEIRPRFEGVVDESSGCNAITDKSVITTLLGGHLLSHLGSSGGERSHQSRKQINRRIFGNGKLLIENEYYNCVDLTMTADRDDYKLQDDPAYKAHTKEEQIEVPEVSLKIINKKQLKHMIRRKEKVKSNQESVQVSDTDMVIMHYTKRYFYKR